MHVEYILLTIGLSGIIIGSITDIQKREVADSVNYSLIFGGLGIRLIHSLATFEWMFFLQGLMGFGAFLALAYLMFFTGQWGGGDSKMLMGMGALFATYPSVLLQHFSPNHIGFPFLITFWINLLIFGAIYGILWTIGLGIFHFEDMKKAYKGLIKEDLIKKIRLATHIISGILIIYGGISSQLINKLFGIVFGIMILLFFYMYIIIKSVEKSSMYKIITPDKLVEGDWPVDDVICDNKVVFARNKKIGFETEDIKKIMKLYESGKIKKIKVKNGVPFVPSFLFALVVSLTYGNIIAILI
jgi:Flp pilus assembly protein protease CpaA